MYCSMNIREHFITDVSEDKEEVIKCWNSSASGSPSRNFFKEFFNVAAMLMIETVSVIGLHSRTLTAYEACALT